MANCNPLNNVTLIGSIARISAPLVNKDGSKKLFITIAVRNNYKNRDGSIGVQYPQVEAFVPATVAGIGAWALLEQGTPALISAEVRTSSYEKDGVMHYTTALSARGFELLESKSAAQDRKRRKAAWAAAHAAAAAPAPAAAPAVTEEAFI